MKGRSPYKLRDDLVIQRRIYAGQPAYVVKDPLRLKYYTINEASFTLLSLCNGRRDLSALTEAAEEAFPGMGYDALTLLNFYEEYRKTYFFEDAWERNILLIEKQRTSRLDALKNALANPLEIHLPAWNPDRFLARLDARLGFFFTRPAVVAYVVLFLLATWITVTHAEEFSLPLSQIYVIQGKALVGLLTLWLILLFTVLLHEIGHGLTCKHFGGGVYKIGFLFLYFNPCLFCDVTEAYFFENRKHRHAVTLGGGVVDLMVASLATFVWFATPSDLFVHEVAHRIAIFCGVTGLLFNFNPLLKYDGYYLLSDYLEIPNLRGESFRFLSSRFRSLLGMPAGSELYSARERKVFWTYGLLALAYSAFVLWLILTFVGGWLVATFRALGYILALALFIVLTMRAWKHLAAFARFLALDRRGHFLRHRWLYAGGLAGVIGLLLLVPFPRTVTQEFVVRPGAEVIMRAQVAGIIEEVNVREGDVVQAGEAPVLLRSEEIEMERLKARAVRVSAELKRGSAQVSRDLGLAAAHLAEGRSNAALESYYGAQSERLSPPSPVTAVVLSPRLEERRGAACTPGDTLCELGDLGALKAEVLTDESLLGMIDRDAPVELRSVAAPGRLLQGKVEMISLEPSGGRLRKLYRIAVRLDDPDRTLRPGMTGLARFQAGRVSALNHFLGRAARALRIEFWV